MANPADTAKLALKKQAHLRMIKIALSVAPGALEATKQFTSREIAVFKLAQALGNEGRYADAAKVLAQRGMMTRLQDMVSSILKIGNKVVVDEVTDLLTAAPVPAKANPYKTAWVVSYRGKNVRFPWYDPKLALEEIYKQEVKPFLKKLKARGIDLDDVVVVDATDMDQYGR